MAGLWVTRWARNAGLGRGLIPALRMPPKAEAAKGGKGGAAAGGEAAAAKDDKGGAGGEVINGVNFLKDGKDPVVLPDDQYPEWLWGLLEPKPTFTELNMKFEADPHSLNEAELQRMLRLENRARIKAHNKSKAKE